MLVDWVKANDGEEIKIYIERVADTIYCNLDLMIESEDGMFHEAGDGISMDISYIPELIRALREVNYIFQKTDVVKKADDREVASA